MIAAGLELGVNFFDSCTPLEEHSVPGEVIKRLKKRDQIVVSARLCHKMKGVLQDKRIIEQWVEERLRLWQTDRFDILMLTNTENDTPQSGYWDMSYSLETVDKLKRQGKIRYAGFGCHFTPAWFREAFARFGKQWDICSVPVQRAASGRGGAAAHRREARPGHRHHQGFRPRRTAAATRLERARCRAGPRPDCVRAGEPAGGLLHLRRAQRVARAGEFQCFVESLDVPRRDGGWRRWPPTRPAATWPGSKMAGCSPDVQGPGPLARKVNCPDFATQATS